MVDIPFLNEYFAILLSVFAGGVGIMLKIRNQDINRIEKKIDNVIEHLNSTSSIQTQYLAEINASLKTMIEFMKNNK